METPYLIFVGDEADPSNAKTATGVVFWRPDICVGQYKIDSNAVDLALQNMTLAEGKAAGAKTLLIGVTNNGGFIPDTWLPALKEALEAGYNLAAGLHMRLNDIPELRNLANAKGLTLYDLRCPPENIPVGNGLPRSGKRLLTVGTDCAMGKMFTTLALEKEMQHRKMNADFRATGQTGIFIAGTGIPIDAVVSDFISGAAEQVSPINTPDHWDLIEGQGSLLHPAYAGVTLGLLHGSQPDYMVLCHRVGLTAIHEYEHAVLPPLQEVITIYEQAAQLTNKKAKVIGISLITKGMEKADALASLKAHENEFNMPCFDPVLTGVSSMVDVLEKIDA